MKLSRKTIFYLVFFTLLFGGFYLFALKNVNLSAAPLVVINPAVPAFRFINQNGDTITQATTDGKVYVANYFFTTCKGICPKMNANMRVVYDVYKNEKDFMILSHTCMPETDSVPLLKAYEQRMVNGKLIKNDDGSYRVTNNPVTSNPNTNWEFLTGKKDDLYRLAREGYIIDNGHPDSSQNISQQFIHTQLFALVDRFHRVRGIYDGLKQDEIQKLIGDIHSLLKEKVDHPRFMNNFSNNPG